MIVLTQMFRMEQFSGRWGVGVYRCCRCTSYLAFVRFHAFIERLEIVSQRHASHDYQLVRETVSKSRHGIDDQHQQGYPRVVIDDAEHLRKHVCDVDFQHLVGVLFFRRYDARQQVAQMFHCNVNLFIFNY